MRQRNIICCQSVDVLHILWRSLYSQAISSAPLRSCRHDEVTVRCPTRDPRQILAIFYGFAPVVALLCSAAAQDGKNETDAALPFQLPDPNLFLVVH